ncbi:MAG: ABC transporter ATP-binding protein [Pseudomonadota bacterium]
MLLEVENLQSGYGKLTILHGINLVAKPGEITTVLGPNGAGKSTLMKAIAGHLPVKAGDIRFRGDSIAGHNALHTCMAGIGYVPQESNVFAELSVRDNLRAAALAFPNADTHIQDVFERFPILEERGSQAASTLSGGERQTLAIATALVGTPSLVVLDEPTAGLAPMFVERIIDWVTDLARDGMAVVWVVEQNPEKVLAVSETTYIVEAGQNADVMASSALLEPGRLEEVVFEMKD